MAPPSLASTPSLSVPGASIIHIPLSTPHTHGGTPEIEIVSASGRGSPARSDITMRRAASNTQLRDMLNDLRNQTDKFMQQQNRTNEAIEELQNRPSVQFPLLVDDLPTPIYFLKLLTLSRRLLRPEKLQGIFQ
jgi:hypothetical protein